MVYKTLKDWKYENIIPGISDEANKSVLKEEYITAYLTCISRVFGWGLPCTTVIPFADCINHHNVDSSYEFIKAEWQPISIDKRHKRFKEPLNKNENNLIEKQSEEKEVL